MLKTLPFNFNRPPVLVLGSTLVYILIFIPGYEILWRAIAIVALIPVMIIANHYGIRAGVAAALSNVPFTLFMLRLIGDPIPLIGGPYLIPAHIIFMIVAAVVGHLRNVKLRLSEAEHQIRIRYESIPVPTLTWRYVDGDFVLIDHNPAAIRIWDGDIRRNVGETVSQMFPHRPDLVAHVREAMSQKTTLVKETSYDFESTGQAHYLRIQSTFIAPDLVLTHVDDITSVKQADQQALELALATERVALMRKFVNDISHDLKTPLTGILTSLYLLRKQSDPNKRDQHLIQLEGRVKHLEKLMTDIIAMSRLDNTTELELTPVNVHRMIYFVVESLKEKAEGKGIQVRVELGENLPPVLADYDELCRALLELADNAVNYSPANGVVSLRATQVDGQISITIKDSGIGMDASELANIFQRFYRVEQARTTDDGGTGLGLAITQRIVELHHGTIEVNSQAQHGTTFTVLLPIYSTSSPSSSAGISSGSIS